MTQEGLRSLIEAGISWINIGRSRNDEQGMGFIRDGVGQVRWCIDTARARSLRVGSLAQRAGGYLRHYESDASRKSGARKQ